MKPVDNAIIQIVAALFSTFLLFVACVLEMVRRVRGRK